MIRDDRSADEKSANWDGYAQRRRLLRLAERPETPRNEYGVDNIYCHRCFLSTPRWRGKCIHCKAALKV